MNKLLFSEELELFLKIAENCDDTMLEKDVGNNFHDCLSKFCDTYMDFMYEHIAEWHNEYLKDEKANVKHIEKIWGKAFASYECYIESHAHFSKEHQKFLKQNRKFETNKEGECLYTALWYINGRAIQVGNEILVLLKNGYADGAYARHRTLYELSIIADFISKYGDDVAKKYIEYTGKWYDWAKDVIQKDKVRFNDIEAHTSLKQDDLEKWQNEYRISSKLVHASAQGTFSRLALKEPMKEILIGPCDHGMSLVAENALQSLFHVGSLCMGFDKDIYSLMLMSLLMEIKEKACLEFDKTEKSVFTEENKNV